VGFRVPGFNFLFSGFRPRDVSFGFRVWGFGFRVWGFGFRVPRVLDFRFGSES
jgi:hypothetical protein